MVFHWSLSDSKSPQVSRSLLSILADLVNAVVGMVSTCPLIFKSSSPFINPLLTVLSALIIKSITVTFMIHSFSSSLFAFFQFYPFVSRNGKVHNSSGSIFSWTISWSDRLAEITWFQRNWLISFSWTDSGLCLYHLLAWPNFNLFTHQIFKPFAISASFERSNDIKSFQ